MSAKLAYQKAPIQLPEIPAEIWLHIHRLATLTPDHLEHPPLLLDHKGLRLGYKLSTFEATRHRVSLVTKRYIVRVCSQWRALATPFLYEHIVITKAYGLGILEQSLTQSLPSRDSNDSQHLGHLTKRLDISMARTEWAKTNPDPPSNRKVQEILGMVPNLVMLNIVYSFDVDFYPLANSIPPNLKYLNWADAQKVSLPRWKSFLDSHPHLSFIVPSSTEELLLLPSPNSTASPPIGWPSIRELVFHLYTQLLDYARYFPAGTFPNLEKIHVITHPYLLDIFCAVHGKSLTTIHLTHSSRAPDPEFGDLLQMLPGSCPKLRELMWTWADGMMVKAPTELRQPARLPGFDILAIRYLTQQFAKAEGKRLLEHIFSWIGRPELPLLRTVQLLSESNVVHLQRKHSKAFKNFLHRCSSAGVRVEDHFQMPLNDPSSPEDNSH